MILLAFTLVAVSVGVPPCCALARARAPLDSVNAVIGDAAARAAGDNPSALEERARLAQHLLYVADALSSVAPPLEPDAMAARSALLKHLRRYALRGQFPVHGDRSTARFSAGAIELEGAAVRVPLFIDARGVRCAVGELMHASGAGDLAQHIASVRPFVDVDELIRDEWLGVQVGAWAGKHGFLGEELAMIQPTYSCADQCEDEETISRGPWLRGPCYPVANHEVACEMLETLVEPHTHDECRDADGLLQATSPSYPYITLVDCKTMEHELVVEQAEIEATRNRRIEPVAAQHFAPAIDATLSENLTLSFHGPDYSDIFDVPNVTISFMEDPNPTPRSIQVFYGSIKFEWPVELPRKMDSGRKLMWWVSPSGATVLTHGDRALMLTIARDGNVTVTENVRVYSSPLECSERGFRTLRGQVFMKTDANGTSTHRSVVFPVSAMTSECLRFTYGGESEGPCIQPLSTVGLFSTATTPNVADPVVVLHRLRSHSFGVDGDSARKEEIRLTGELVSAGSFMHSTCFVDERRRAIVSLDDDNSRVWLYPDPGAVSASQQPVLNRIVLRLSFLAIVCCNLLL